MDTELRSSDPAKPIADWACFATGIGFILMLAILLAGARLLGGQ